MLVKYLFRRPMIFYSETFTIIKFLFSSVKNFEIRKSFFNFVVVVVVVAPAVEIRSSFELLSLLFLRNFRSFVVKC